MSLIFVEAFGQLIRDANLEGIVSDEEEDLYSVFNARSELMGWSTTSARSRPLLWGMNEAEVTAGIEADRIGFVQVGPDVDDVEPTEAPPAPGPPILPGPPPSPVQGHGYYAYAPSGVSRREVDPVALLPALILCFDDALRRFGVVELSGIQVTANFLKPRAQSYTSRLVSGLNWFNTTLKGQADAIIAFDQDLLGSHTEAELAAGLLRRNTGSFEFGPLAVVPEQFSVKGPFEDPFRVISPAQSGLGLSVSLPEWTASAAAWVLAMVVDAARAIAPDVSNFAVRITRVR